MLIVSRSCIAAATSYRTYKDTSGDPEELTKRNLTKQRERVLSNYERRMSWNISDCFRRVQLDLGTSESANVTTDQRPLKFLNGSDPQLRSCTFNMAGIS